MRILVLVAAILVLPSPATSQEVPARSAPPAWLGVTYDLQWIHDGGTCASQVVVESVVAGSPAQRAGVRPGDALLAVDGDPSPLARLPMLSARLAPGDRVHLLLGREGATRELTVVADRRPDQPTLVLRSHAMAPRPDGPVIRVHGDTLVAAQLAGAPLTFRSSGRGYWLAAADGSLSYRRLPPRPTSEMDRRAAALLVCAENASRAMPATAPRIELDRVQERADSLRLAITRRALEQRDDEGRVVFRDVMTAPRAAEAAASMIFRLDDAMASNLRGVAGAEIVSMEPELADYFRGVDGGLLVVRVGGGTPAARSGLRPGDVITAAGDRPITAVSELRALVAMPDGGPLELRTVRQGRHRVVTLPRP